MKIQSNKVVDTGCGKSLHDRCKHGWNWHFTFNEETTPSGAKVTAVRGVLLYKTDAGVDIVVSGYPYGHGHREDGVVDELRAAFFELHQDARGMGVEVCEVAGEWFEQTRIGAPIDSCIVADCLQALAKIRRVIVSK